MEHRQPRRREPPARRSPASSKKGEGFKNRPLMIFPLLKELGSGWKNMEITPLLRGKEAFGTRSLVVDVGLDDGDEFFLAIENGFEVIGFEPNPASFSALAGKCAALRNAKCRALVDVSSLSLPLERAPGASYLIHAAAGAEAGELDFFLNGAGSTFNPPPSESEAKNNETKWTKVPVVRIDDYIQEDVYLFKTDTQGFDAFVLQGAAKLFRDHVVRQLIFEVDPLNMARNAVTITELMEMIQNYGMLCFTDRNDVTPECEFMGDTVEQFEKVYFSEQNANVDSDRFWAKCWEDFMCINIEKPYTGAELTVLPRTKRMQSRASPS